MKSKRILVFLIPIFIASLIFGYLQMPRQERVSSQIDVAPAKQKEQKQGSGVKHNDYPRLRSDLLERKSQPYPGVHRDLFLSTIREEEVSPLPVEPPEVIVPPVVPVAPPPPPPPSPQEVAAQDLSPYKFIGFLKKEKKQTIFLSSAGEIFLVHQGDYLGRDRKYYVQKITDTTLELRKDGGGDFLIKLTDQEPLSPVSLQGQRKSERPAASFPPSTQTLSPGSPGRKMLGQEKTLPDQLESLPVPAGESQTGEQLQPEEDNNETKN